jgi:anthranilate phosphoribosyltransferase
MPTSGPTDPLALVIRRLAAGGPLDPQELTDAFGRVMAGEGTPAQIAALLVGMRVKGETAAEIAAVARALRLVMVPLVVDRPEDLVDTCGTGGGTVSTFNISTAAALVAAGGGARVAKHGNRSFTSQSGSADVLEALGVRIDVPLAVMQHALREARITFMFAPLMHPAMRHVNPVRRELAIPSVMNIVGPLANPAGAARQVIGVADADRVPLMAGALRELGAQHAMVVHGSGMDEISPVGKTRVVELRDGAITEWEIDPADFGLSGGRLDELAGGSAAENAQTILCVLRGTATRSATAAVILNAAAALYVGGIAASFEEGIERARDSLRGGAGLDALDRLRHAQSAA